MHSLTENTIMKIKKQYSKTTFPDFLQTSAALLMVNHGNHFDAN